MYASFVEENVYDHLYTVLLLTQKVGAGRKMFGYKLPLMIPAIDIHAYDVVSGGALLNNGDRGLWRSLGNFVCLQYLRPRLIPKIICGTFFFFLDSVDFYLRSILIEMWTRQSQKPQIM